MSRYVRPLLRMSRQWRKQPRWFTLALLLALILIGLNVLSGVIDSPLALAASTPSQVLLKGGPSTPNHMSPTGGSQSLTHPATQPTGPSNGSGSPQIISHNQQV